MQKPGSRADVVLGLIFAALGGALFTLALSYRNMPGMPVGAGLFPRIVGGGMVVFGAVLALQGWFTRPALVAADAPAEDEHARTGKLDWTYVGLVLGAIVATIFLMPVLGFLLTSFVFCIFIVRLSGGSWLSAIIFSPVMTYLTYLGFYHGFRVPLPRGLLG
ncbi:MAG: tripartite tricarboxylate transporter TctB family protein [Devosia sp.]